MAIDLAPFAGSVGGSFIVGFITGYAIKKVIKLSAIIVCLFFAALAYLQYQQIRNMDWHEAQAISQNRINWVTDALTHVSSTFDASHPGTLSNIEIPLASSVSADFVLGSPEADIDYLMSVQHVITSQACSD